MKLVVGADHKGFELKRLLVKWLKEKNVDVEDVGAVSLDPHDDYPEYALRVSRAVEENKCLGVVICGSGVGVCIVANKVDGIRCGQGMNENQVKAARTDDDITVLALAAEYVDLEHAKQMVEVFMKTNFSGEERHVRRLAQVQELEKGT